MKIKHMILGALLFIAMGLGTAQAASLPLQLSYTVTPIENNRYNYDFTLTLTNEDNSWVSGGGWGEITFGDSTQLGTYPLSNFVGDVSSLAGTPFTRFDGVSGFFGPGVSGNIWYPTAVGETIGWSGTSTADLAQGELLWNTHTTIGFAAEIQYAVAVRTNPIPEPGTFVLAGMGLVSLLGLRRREQGA